MLLFPSGNIHEGPYSYCSEGLNIVMRLILCVLKAYYQNKTVLSTIFNAKNK